MRKLAAEFFGTFALVVAGTGAIVINDIRGGSVTHVGVSMTFGLMVLAMIFAVGDVSGAHLNPDIRPASFSDCCFPIMRRLEPPSQPGHRCSRSFWK